MVNAELVAGRYFGLDVVMVLVKVMVHLFNIRMIRPLTGRYKQVIRPYKT